MGGVAADRDQRPLADAGSTTRMSGGSHWSASRRTQSGRIQNGKMCHSSRHRGRRHDHAARPEVASTRKRLHRCRVGALAFRHRDGGDQCRRERHAVCPPKFREFGRRAHAARHERGTPSRTGQQAVQRQARASAALQAPPATSAAFSTPSALISLQPFLIERP